jgi:hypothetical protein
MGTVDVAGWLGGPGHSVRGGQAELCCPAFDVGPEPVALVQVSLARSIAVMAVLRSRAT